MFGVWKGVSRCALLVAVAMVVALGTTTGFAGKPGGGGTPPPPPVQYRIDFLGGLGTAPEAGMSYARGLNNRGEIVGNANDRDGVGQAFLNAEIDGARIMVHLSLSLNATQRSYWRILKEANDVSDVVYDSESAGWVVVVGRGYVWPDVGVSPTERTFRLTIPANYTVTFDEASGYFVLATPCVIDDLGADLRAPSQIDSMASYGTGDFDTAAGTRGYLLDMDSGSSINLGVLTSAQDFSRGTDVNAAGQVAGFAGVQGGSDWRAFLYTPGQGMTDLSLLTISKHTPRFAYGINAAGDVVGYGVKGVQNFNVTHRAFRYRRVQNTMDNLGTLGGQHSWALAINNLRDVVGTSDDSAGQWHPFLYVDGPGMLKVESLIVQGSAPLPLTSGFQWVQRINDGRQVIGNAGDPHHPDDYPWPHPQAYVLTPVP